ncbi:MAG: hypothetical protein HY238_20740 [Acidobacteria bacterium]|nr:hypothetical protein [Acidobacteriota bacterium]
MQGTAAQQKKVSEPSVITEVITPAAEQFAQAKGLSQAVGLTREIVHQAVPAMSALNVDVAEDPEDEDLTTICFTITTRESVDDAVKSYYALQEALYQRMPVEERFQISFRYQFE